MFSTRRATPSTTRPRPIAASSAEDHRHTTPAAAARRLEVLSGQIVRTPPNESALRSSLDGLEARKQVYPDGQARPDFARQVDAFEREHHCELARDPAARARLQDLQARVGLSSAFFPEIPISNEPFWLRGPDPLANHQSTPDLPKRAGLLIIGAGLTGSTALHLALEEAHSILDPAISARLSGASAEEARRLYAAHPKTREARSAFRASLDRALEAALAHTEASVEDHRTPPSALGPKARRYVAHGLFDAAAVVMVDGQDPCQGASGRNGGNRGLTENFEKTYEGLFEERVKLHMKARGDDLSGEVLARAPADVRARAERETRFIIESWEQSRLIHGTAIRATKTSCDLKEGGWIKTAETPGEQAALARDVQRLEAKNIPARIVDGEELRARFGLDEPFGGMETRGETYHPAKYVRGVISHGLGDGARLYARTQVLGVKGNGPGDNEVPVRRGEEVETLACGLVFAATNAYTSSVFQGFDAVQPYRSQVAVFDHVDPRMGKTFLTGQQGDDYGNHPNPRTLIQGGGLDTPVSGLSGYENPRVDPEVHQLLVRYADKKIGPRPELAPDAPGKRWTPPTAEWTGLMGFTPMKLPFVGAMEKDKDIWLAAGFNGYGNTFAPYAAKLALLEALYGRANPWHDLLSPMISREPGPTSRL